MSSAPRWLETIKSALLHPDNKGKISECNQSCNYQSFSFCVMLYAVYQVATVDANGHPRVRSQVHRGFIEPEGHPELPILVTSTDARSPKVTEARGNQKVELAWWMEGTQDQFRLSGFVHLCPSPAQGDPTPIPLHAAALKLLQKSGFDFEAKRKETFDKMSTVMRASWCVPHPPGTIVPDYDEQSKTWPREVPLEQDAKTDDERKDVEIASRNFALMLIEPDRVDWVSLASQPMKRVYFARDGEKWMEDQAVP